MTTEKKKMSAGASLLVLLLMAVVGATAFFLVFEWIGANGYVSAAIYLVILAGFAVAETVLK